MTSDNNGRGATTALELALGPLGLRRDTAALGRLRYPGQRAEALPVEGDGLQIAARPTPARRSDAGGGLPSGARSAEGRAS